MPTLNLKKYLNKDNKIVDKLSEKQGYSFSSFI